MGQERSVLPPSWSGGLQARHSPGHRALPRDRALRARDPRHRRRGGHQATASTEIKEFTLMATTQPLIVFDVNETLLDLRVLEPVLERIFRDRGAMRLWFANLILYSTAL